MSKIYKVLFVSLLLLLSTQTVFAGRYYDSATGRWLTVDPKAGKYPNISPYAYCLNNPLKNVDPDGKDPTGITESTIVVVSGIAILTAVTIHTFEYTTNSSYRNQYNSYISSTSHLVTNSIGQIGNFIGNLFSSSNKGNSGGQQQTRKSSKQIRKEYEKATGKEWPKDAVTGKNQDVSHIKPLADGGTNELDNVEPKIHKEHIEQHKKNGDFKRWGARRKPNN
jgi:uncharacterized protein RhaS with RHS repeats